MVTETAVATAGKYLTFLLGDEVYGLEILRVAEIVGLVPITRVPRLPRHFSGVINLRGRVIPVVDLRLAFKLPEAELAERTCIVIAQVSSGTGMRTVGLVVDEVSEVLSLGSDAIEATPDFGSRVDTSFIKGVGRTEGCVVMLLDIDLTLTGEQFDALDAGVLVGDAEAVSAAE